MRIALMISFLSCLSLLPGCRTASSSAMAAASVQPLSEMNRQVFDLQSGRHNQSQCNTPGGFSQYLLALSWAPNFCTSNERHSQMGQCQNLGSTFSGTHLTLHGMWPQYSDAEASTQGCAYPAQCSGAQFDSSAIPADMATYGPAYTQDGLGDHEWSKHGTCSGLDQSTYFQSAIKLMQSVGRNQGTPGAITSNIGGQVALSELQSGFQNVPAQSVALNCDDSCNLAQVGICFGADAQGNPRTPVACPSSVMSSPSDNSCVVGGGDPNQPRCSMITIQSATGSGQ